MRERLKKLSIKIASGIPFYEYPQEYYNHLLKIYEKEKLYFSKVSAFDKLLIVLCVYSFKKTNNFELAEKIMNSMFFISLFNTDKETYYEECEECNGSGTKVCDLCDDGRIECSTCGGTGEVECEECGGTGDVDDATCETCSGDGDVTCEDCSGNGSEICGNCNGSGEEECDVCYGDGNVETANQEYEFIDIVSWNPQFNNTCELYQNTYTPIMSVHDFPKESEWDIILYSGQDNVEFKNLDELKTDKYYCHFFSDDPYDLIWLNGRIQIDEQPTFYSA